MERCNPLFAFDNENVMKPQTPTAALTPVWACEEEDPVASAFESPLGKKPCFWESIVNQWSKTAPSHLKPNYDEKELVGFTHPSLVDVIPWIKYEAQNMAEPSFRQELQYIREAEHLQYIIVMIVWFKHWKQDQGWWVPIPSCTFQIRATTTINIETRVLLVIAQVNMSWGESQVLWVLTTLQYLAEVCPKSLPLGHMVHSVQSIMRPLEQLEISFQPHAVLGYGTSVWSSTLMKTDV